MARIQRQRHHGDATWAMCMLSNCTSWLPFPPLPNYSSIHLRRLAVGWESTAQRSTAYHSTAHLRWEKWKCTEIGGHGGG